MSIQCKQITIVKSKKQGARYIDKATGEKPQPGDIFYAPQFLKTEPEESFAPRYVAIKDQRPPIVVVLPSGQWWCIDQRAFDGQNGWHGEGWSLTGEIPNITASPSINTHGYHGFLQNGVLTDDLGGHA